MKYLLLATFASLGLFFNTQFVYAEKNPLPTVNAELNTAASPTPVVPTPIATPSPAATPTPNPTPQPSQAASPSEAPAATPNVKSSSAQESVPVTNVKAAAPKVVEPKNVVDTSSSYLNLPVLDHSSSYTYPSQRLSPALTTTLYEVAGALVSFGLIFAFGIIEMAQAIDLTRFAGESAEEKGLV